MLRQVRGRNGIRIFCFAADLLPQHSGRIWHWGQRSEDVKIHRDDYPVVILQLEREEGQKGI